MTFGGGSSSDIPCVDLEFSALEIEFAVTTRSTPAAGRDGRALDIADGLHRSDVNPEVPPQRQVLTYQSKCGWPQLPNIVEGGIRPSPLRVQAPAARGLDCALPLRAPRPVPVRVDSNRRLPHECVQAPCLKQQHRG